MLQLDVSNAELITLNTNDTSDKVEITVSFTDCATVILEAEMTDTILITDEKLTICTLSKTKAADNDPL